MNKTNCIRAFFVLGILLLVGGIFFWGYSARQKEKEQLAQIEKVEENQTKETSAATALSYEYVIVNEDGYLTVYKSDLKTLYSHTAISYQELGAELQKKIDNGYKVKDMKELYDFLENYSS